MQVWHAFLGVKAGRVEIVDSLELIVGAEYLHGAVRLYMEGDAQRILSKLRYSVFCEHLDDTPELAEIIEVGLMVAIDVFADDI